MGCDHKFPFSLSLPAYPLLHASAQGGGNPFSLIIPVHVKPVQIPIRAHVPESVYPALCLCNHGKMFLKGPVPCFHIHRTAGPGIQLFFCIVPAVNTVYRIVKHLLMDPGGVGRMIEQNFGGVRVDGTNATIIGAGDGNFIADRNGIARVWMDHALWPQMTTRLYMDQTGDVEILNRQAPYFKDAQALRGTALDPDYRPEQGGWQRDAAGQVYTGTLLEHLLIEQLAAFYEVGDHNFYRLRGADWNDALDMAAEHGESVAFTCAYAGNLRELAGMIRLLGHGMVNIQ